MVTNVAAGCEKAFHMALEREVRTGAVVSVAIDSDIDPVIALRQIR